MMAQVKTNPPEEFSGARGKLTQFFTQSALYIYNNQGHFQDDEKKIMFMISYLRGDAYKLIEPFLTDFFTKGPQMSGETRRTLTVLQAFQEKLSLSFGSIDEERKADREIRALRQTASAGDYAVKFERLKAYLSWNDESYRSQFFNGLKWEVKDQLLKRETQPDSLSSLIDMAIKLDDIIYQSNLEKKGRGGGNRRNHGANQGKARRGQDHYGPQPMELDALQKKPGRGNDKSRKGKTSPQKGKCYNCGKEGHYANKCRQPRQRPAGNQNGGHQSTNSFRKLESAETQQFAMMSIGTSFWEKEDKYQWGPNQTRSRNVSAIERILRDTPEVAQKPDHPHHWILPMSECKKDGCPDWNHINVEDQGDPTWDFDGLTKKLHNTKIRMLLKNVGISYNSEHVHHQHIPRNYCYDDDCEYHHPMADGCEEETLRMLKPEPVDTVLGLPTRATNTVPTLRRENATLQQRTLSIDYATLGTEQERESRPLRWARKSNLDDTSHEGQHRDLPSSQCKRETCVWHQRRPTPMPRILDTISRNFTPETTDTESEDNDLDDQYLNAIQGGIGDLLFDIKDDFKHRVEMSVPNPKYDIFVRLLCDPEATKPSHRFSLKLKVVAREIASESEDEEESASEDEELIHGSEASGNEAGQW
jgi:hypothetical protein